MATGSCAAIAEVRAAVANVGSGGKAAGLLADEASVEACMPRDATWWTARSVPRLAHDDRRPRPLLRDVSEREHLERRRDFSLTLICSGPWRLEDDSNVSVESVPRRRGSDVEAVRRCASMSRLSNPATFHGSNA